jgi:hypothetical protein
MKKDAIKILKRNSEAEKTQSAADAPKVESETQRTIVNAVKDWISERRENSRAEKDFSDDEILRWK